MSWDAYMQHTCDQENESYNYTYNTSRMIYDAMAVVGIKPVERGNWCALLDAKSARDGWLILSNIVSALESTPLYYEGMNPSNGWGSYDGLLGELRRMRDDSACGGSTCVWNGS